MANKDMTWINSSFSDGMLSPTISIPPPISLENAHQGQPWTEKFLPENLESVAVHKKKIGEVADWFSNTLSTVKRKILLITGSPGCGKTATVKAIATEKNIEIREWANQSYVKYDPDSNYKDMEKLSDQFIGFLLVTSKYNSICQTSYGSACTVLLVEEFPGNYTKHPELFHDILRKASHSHLGKPIIFILSESSGQDKFTKKMFPPELQEELGIENISFNPVSSTLLAKALNRIIFLQSDKKLYNKNAHKDIVDGIVNKCNGDIRAAVNALEFLLGYKKLNQPGSSKRKRKKTSDVKTTEDVSGAVGANDSSLLLFRAIGKVLYCKRETNLPPSFLPPHLSQFQRCQLLENPENIIDRTPIENRGSLGLFLHHNGTSFFQDIERYSHAMLYLGDSDILDSYWTSNGALESYGPSLAVRGFMFNIDGSHKKTFRPLTGPTWFSYIKSSAQKKLELESFKRTHSNLNFGELATDVLPLVSKIGDHSGLIDKCSREGNQPDDANVFSDPEEDFLIEDYDE